MKRVKIKARKLADPRVQFISLVDRGANRMPFKIVKQQESEMLNLDKVFKRSTTAAVVPVSVMAIAVLKREDMAPVIEVIKNAGYKTDAVVERDDGTVMFTQVDGFDEASCSVYKVSDEVVALLSGSMVKKAEGASFIKDMFSAHGYLPSAQEACSAVVMSVLKEMKNVDDGNVDGFKSMLKSDFDELADYIGDTIESLPAGLHSLDMPAIVAKSEVADGAEDDATDTGVQDELPLEAPADETVTKSEGDAEDKAAAPAVDLTQQLAPLTGQIKDMLLVVKSLSDGMAAITDDLKAVKEVQSALTDTVAEASRVAKEANEAVTGTVVSAAPAADRQPTSRIHKSGDSDPRSGLFDTAFLPGARH